MQGVVGMSIWTWRVPVLRQALLPESLVDFSGGTSHQRLHIYTVVCAVMQLRKDSSSVGSPHPLGMGQ